MKYCLVIRFKSSLIPFSGKYCVFNSLEDLNGFTRKFRNKAELLDEVFKSDIDYNGMRDFAVSCASIRTFDENREAHYILYAPRNHRKSKVPGYKSKNKSRKDYY